MTQSTQDRWAQWLLQRRHGGDVEKLRVMLPSLSQIHDKVLKNARLAQNETLLDVGCGDGLAEVHLELQVEIMPGKFERDADAQKPNWETFLKSSPNPLVPTTEEIMNEALTDDEARQFTTHLRPLVEAKQYVRRSALTYLWAVKH